MGGSGEKWETVQKSKKSGGHESRAMGVGGRGGSRKGWDPEGWKWAEVGRGGQNRAFAMRCDAVVHSMW